MFKACSDVLPAHKITDSICSVFVVKSFFLSSYVMSYYNTMTKFSMLCVILVTSYVYKSRIKQWLNGNENKPAPGWYTTLWCNLKTWMRLIASRLVCLPTMLQCRWPWFRQKQLNLEFATKVLCNVLDCFELPRQLTGTSDCGNLIFPAVLSYFTYFVHCCIFDFCLGKRILRCYQGSFFVST